MDFFLFRIFLFVAKWSTYFGAITCYLRERKKTKREIFFVERNFNDAKSVAEHATYTHTNVNQSSVCIKMWSERTREFCFFLRTFGIHMCGREGDSLTFAFRFLICRSSLCLKTKPTFCPVSHFWPNSAILMWFRERITREKKKPEIGWVNRFWRQTFRFFARETNTQTIKSTFGLTN